MILLPPNLTAEGLVRRIDTFRHLARFLERTGTPLATSLETRCRDVELVQARLARAVEPVP